MDVANEAGERQPSGALTPPATAVAPARCLSCEQTPPDAAAWPAPAYVFSLGRIEPRFPSLGVEKEFAQVRGRSETAGLADREAMQAVLSDPVNRYLLRQLCWVFTVEGIDTYLLRPNDAADLDLLTGALRAQPNAHDVDVVIGVRGPVSPPEACGGLMLPMVFFDQIYSFDRDALIANIPRPDRIPADRFETTAGELFDRIIQMTDNAGATDEHRALNYLCVRYPAVYERTAVAFAEDQSLTRVEAVPSRLSGPRTVVDVIFSYTSRTTDVVDQYFVRVDVTERFPFLVTKMQPYFAR